MIHDLIYMPLSLELPRPSYPQKAAPKCPKVGGQLTKKRLSKFSLILRRSFGRKNREEGRHLPENWFSSWVCRTYWCAGLWSGAARGRCGWAGQRSALLLLGPKLNHFKIHQKSSHVKVEHQKFLSESELNFHCKLGQSFPQKDF